MFYVKLKEKWFGVPNGVTYNDYNLIIPVIIGDSSLEEIKELLTPVQEEINIYDENKKDVIALFNGYTELGSLNVEYNKQRIDIDETADMITITLNKFGLKELREQLIQNTNDIEVNESQTIYTAMMTDTLINTEE